jgi:hypothetical protein
MAGESPFHISFATAVLHLHFGPYILGLGRGGNVAHLIGERFQARKVLLSFATT